MNLRAVLAIRFSSLVPPRHLVTDVGPVPPVPSSPPSDKWVTPDSIRVNAPRFYVVIRGRCCGVFASWGYVSPLVYQLPKDERFFFMVTDYETALEEYTSAKNDGEVRLIGRTSRDIAKYGPPHLCIM
ncbi:hypothetical protein DFP72DRAFT_1084109 [Ephemerocybe angulata]|uniref:Uncharacterized protein n=1 Tax=Ephemerocybe angulata TaxID=980116 RepID=A0A8H6H8C6_9AGAR|nr:hypothetical protein DFP72DRAFT_1084109 [Tulosesus angulatus]